MKSIKTLTLIALPVLAAVFACTPDDLTVTLSGRVWFAGDSTKTVKGTVVEAVSAGQSYQTSVKADGTFSIDAQPGDYIVRPFRRTDTLNGIDTEDRTMIQQHLVGMIGLNQWQKFAADVNKSGMMTSLDAYTVQAAILGNADGRSIVGGWWTFCPADYTAAQTDGYFVPAYPTTKEVQANGDVTGIDFVAFRRGDVNLNAKTEQ